MVVRATPASRATASIVSRSYPSSRSRRCVVSRISRSASGSLRAPGRRGSRNSVEFMNISLYLASVHLFTLRSVALQRVASNLIFDVAKEEQDGQVQPQGSNRGSHGWIAGYRPPYRRGARRSGREGGAGCPQRAG